MKCIDENIQISYNILAHMEKLLKQLTGITIEYGKLGEVRKKIEF